MHSLRPSAGLVAALIAFGLTGAAWGSDARRRSRRAALVHRTMVELLLNTLCAGDSDTARHSRRVADLTDVLARTFRLNREVRARLRVGALLHDLGKLDGDVAPLVQSEQRLDDQQRGVVRRHTLESAGILQPLESIHPGITLIVESHHERWDGSGYPLGLAGPQIPLESRIISVADVFDALTQPRSYHAPVQAEKVLAKLRDEAGTTFDPQVVARLERPEVWSAWLEIAREGRREEQTVAAGGATG